MNDEDTACCCKSFADVKDAILSYHAGSTFFFDRLIHRTAEYFNTATAKLLQMALFHTNVVTSVIDFYRVQSDATNGAIRQRAIIGIRKADCHV